MKSKLIQSVLIAVSTLALSAHAVSDSGKSALPPKDSPLHQHYYKLYAPKNQTSFKQYQLITQQVDRCERKY